MYKNTPTTINNPGGIATVERRTPMQKVWEAVPKLIEEHRAKAEAGIQRDGKERNGPADVFREASINLRRELAHADTETMSATQHTATKIALLLFEAPNAAASRVLLKNAAGGETKLTPRAKDNALTAVTQFRLDLVDTVASLPTGDLRKFDQKLRENIADDADTYDLPHYSDTMLAAMIAGARRKAAVWRALRGTLPTEYDLRPAEVEEAWQSKDLVVGVGDTELALSIQSDEIFADTLRQLARDGQAHNPNTTTFVYNKYGTCIIKADALFGRLRPDEIDHVEPDAVGEFVRSQLEAKVAAQADDDLRNIGRYAISR